MVDRTEIMISFTEDQGAFQRKFLRAFQILGFSKSQIRMTFTAAETLEQYKAEKPHIVFLDQNLADSFSHLDGMELLEELQKLNGGVIMGMLSGSSEQSEIDRAASLGGVFFVKKVGSTQALVERLGKWADMFLVENPPTTMQTFLE